MRIGFVPLIDAAPLIAARELGFFEEEGLNVSLYGQIGWGNVRDKLSFGQLDAAQALVGMPPASVIGCDGFAEPFVSIMALGTGGNAITVSRVLNESGVSSAATLAAWIRRGSAEQRPPVFAHVFGCSTHHYLLREWLAGAGLQPDLDVRLCALPPCQMARQMRDAHVDGFCVGEPWNSYADAEGWGRIITPTSHVLPNHPEKVLAVRRSWLAVNHVRAMALCRAVIRGCRFCAEPANTTQLAEILASPSYLNADRAIIDASFNLEVATASRAKHVLPPNWKFRDFSPSATFPSGTHAAWIVEQMIRWGHVPHDVHVMDVAARSVDTAAYREAAVALGVSCPPDDFPSMRLRNGQYEPKRRRMNDVQESSPRAAVASASQ